MLDFYNPRTNWLARCFTIEYAGWFRLVLPGLAAPWPAVPLGGTTLFFRRDVLEQLGGWDAHNVTEDADLGMRLARHGYRTELIDTDDLRRGELPAAAVGQAALALDQGLHDDLGSPICARPALLWRQLGAARLSGLSGPVSGHHLSQSLLAPLLWSILVAATSALAIRWPQRAEPRRHRLSSSVLFCRRRGGQHRSSASSACAGRATSCRLLWVPTLTLYFPLAPSPPTRRCGSLRPARSTGTRPATALFDRQPKTLSAA